jgi:hypothetical protein
MTDHRTRGGTAGRLVLLVVVVTVVAGLAGFVFGRADPERAAALLIRDFVVAEPVGSATAGPAPSSGERAAAPQCGVMDRPVHAAIQVATLGVGGVVVQYRDPESAKALGQWAAAHVATVLLAPNPDLEHPVVATAWGRRMALASANLEMLSAFVAAHGGQGPDRAGCG